MTSHDEVREIEHRSLLAPPTGHLLKEAVARQVSEFDLAAYTKDEFTLSMQKNIMRRMFEVFDVQQAGYITNETLGNLCEYLGRPLTSIEPMTAHLDELPDKNKVKFEHFWEWWLKYFEMTPVGRETFATLSAEFKVPFHQQQLSHEEVGEKYTPGFRVKFFFEDMETTEKRQVSPWHDIPLYCKDLVRTHLPGVPSNRFNFICEIPKWTRAKFEISTTEPFNPIKQDMKNGVPRFYKHGDMMWNYGAFPQTWESTEITFFEGIQGDNDPLDAIEIGMTQLKTGEVAPVKVIGVLGMIDDGQMDWKVICILKGDPIEKFINDIDDVPKYLPGCLDALREWLRTYKICQGGVENKFAFDGEYKDKEFARKIIKESHFMWKNLRSVKGTSFFGKDGAGEKKKEKKDDNNNINNKKQESPEKASAAAT